VRIGRGRPLRGPGVVHKKKKEKRDRKKEDTKRDLDGDSACSSASLWMFGGRTPPPQRSPREAPKRQVPGSTRRHARGVDHLPSLIERGGGSVTPKQGL